MASKRKAQGVLLTHFDDYEPGELVDPEGRMMQVSSFEYVQPVDDSIRRAIVLDKAAGHPTSVIAAKYEIAESTVRSIWRAFTADAAQIRFYGSRSPAEFKETIRQKAQVAITNGLECDRDPYRQGRLGIDVMKGIGDFVPDNGPTKIAVLVQSVPAEWAGRYFGLSDVPNQQVLDTPKEEDNHAQ